jgi:hypothetical protein
MTSTGTRDHVSPLTAMLYPAYTERCEHCGGFVAISPEEALKRTFEAAYQPWAALARAMQQPIATGAAGLPTAPTATPSDWTTEWTRSWTGSKHHHHDHHWKHDCRCEPCIRDDCHCMCCIVNADLVVYTRLGERRLVPLMLENNRRRERQIKLELSEFRSKGGAESGVNARLLTPDEFTLDPCEQREVLIGIQVGEEGGEEGPRRSTASKGEGPKGESGGSEKKEEEEARKLPDVDECRVAYADLRIVGCDNRPIRIAVATLSRDCHDYRVDCGCACCD